MLEIGTGPGRFTQLLAELGCRIVVADISPVQLTLNRQKANELGFAAAIEDWLLLDICDMGVLPDESFDAVVGYGGPLSYVFEQREAALGKCVRVTKPGGTILGVMSLWGSAHAFLPEIWGLPVELNRRIIETGDTVEGKHRCHMYRYSEFRSLLRSAGADAARDVSIQLSLNTLRGVARSIRHDEARWNDLLQMELDACREPGCLDMGTHMIAVVSKR